MRVVIFAFILIFNSSVAFSQHHIEEIVGTWVSQRGALYESDGSNFVCVYIPKQHMEKYKHWLNKNRLTDFQRTKNGLVASQYLRKKNGETSKVAATIELKARLMILRYKIPSREKPVKVILNKVSTDAHNKPLKNGRLTATL